MTPRERYMLYALGFGDGAVVRVVRHPDREDYLRGWAPDRPGPVPNNRWCCMQRKRRPQARVEALMRQAGVWDAALEALS